MGERISAILAPQHKTPLKFRHGTFRFDGEPGKTYELPAADFALLEARGIVVAAAGEISRQGAKAAKDPTPGPRFPVPDKE